VLIGTFETINKAAEMNGDRHACWICLVYGRFEKRRASKVCTGAA
jgi:hypothetical protein